MPGFGRDKYWKKLYVFLVGFLEVLKKTLEEFGHGFLSGVREVRNKVSADARERFLGGNRSEVPQVGFYANGFHALEQLSCVEELAALERVYVERNAFFEATDDEMPWSSDRLDRNTESTGNE